jgi:hypothetical protein
MDPKNTEIRERLVARILPKQDEKFRWGFDERFHLLWSQ